jgi:hypothetical protein
MVTMIEPESNPESPQVRPMIVIHGSDDPAPGRPKFVDGADRGMDKRDPCVIMRGVRSPTAS